MRKAATDRLQSLQFFANTFAICERTVQNAASGRTHDYGYRKQIHLVIHKRRVSRNKLILLRRYYRLASSPPLFNTVIDLA